jgi:hypothetical protein
MAGVSSNDILYKLQEINEILGKKYRLEHPREERDWRTYEQQFSQRIKAAMKDLDPLIHEAVSALHIVHGPGHPHSLSLEQRVKLLLIKQLVASN